MKRIIIGFVVAAALGAGALAAFHHPANPTTTPQPQPQVASASDEVGFQGDFSAGRALEAMFGNYDAANHRALWNMAPEKGQDPRKGPTRVVSDVIGEKVLSPTMAVVVTQQSAYEAGVEMDECPNCFVEFVAYFFTKTAGGWRLEQDQTFYDNGGQGNPGEIKIVDLGPGRPGMVLSSGFASEGYMTETIQLYEIAKDKVLPLTPEVIHVESNNSGTCDDSAVTSSDVPEDAGNEDELRLQPCYEVTGKWHFSKQATNGYYDLVIDLRGILPEESQQPIKSRARYQVRKGHYALVKGRNLAKEMEP